MSALDFERERGTTTDWSGMPTNAVKAVLEAYTFTGVLGLARRDGNRRYYDLPERLLPAKVLARSVPLREQLRHKMLSRYRAHGLLGASSGSDVFPASARRSPKQARPDLPGRTALREELIAAGELVPVEVEGIRGNRFALKEEVDLLDGPPLPPPSVAFLSPFDPLVWDRKLLGSLFDFDTSGGSLSRRPSGVGAGTCCRSSSETGSSAGSSRASTGNDGASRCSTCGGRTASHRVAPRDSLTPCATRFMPTCVLRARRASSGRHTSTRRNGSSAQPPMTDEHSCLMLHSLKQGVESCGRTKRLRIRPDQDRRSSPL